MSLAGGAELLTKGRAFPGCLGGILPFALLAPLPETIAILFADGWLLMGQELGDSLACHRAGRQLSGNVRNPGEIGDHLGGFLLDDQAAIVPCGEVVDRGGQPRENGLVHDRRRRRGGPMIFEKLRRFGDQLHGRVWRRVHQFGEKVLAAASARHRWNSSQPFGAAISSKPCREPGVHQILERQFGGGRVDDLGAGIDPGLDGVGSHELLAEAVDRGAGDLVEGLRTTLDVFVLGCRQARRQYVPQLPRDGSAQQLAGEPLDALEKLARGSFGEGGSVAGIPYIAAISAANPANREEPVNPRSLLAAYGAIFAPQSVARCGGPSSLSSRFLKRTTTPGARRRALIRFLPVPVKT